MTERPRPSIGASGGVMGLVGFLWMLARLHPREHFTQFWSQLNLDPLPLLPAGDVVRIAVPVPS